MKERAYETTTTSFRISIYVFGSRSSCWLLFDSTSQGWRRGWLDSSKSSSLNSKELERLCWSIGDRRKRLGKRRRSWNHFCGQEDYPTYGMVRGGLTSPGKILQECFLLPRPPLSPVGENISPRVFKHARQLMPNMEGHSNMQRKLPALQRRSAHAKTSTWWAETVGRRCASVMLSHVPSSQQAHPHARRESGRDSLSPLIHASFKSRIAA